ncbi:MAG: T9SS type A sorting domain-containing protein [Bacteroidales bacterium]|nr:T9SS type A sorting domain-containing protein [Bacteroidales bacterium]
MNKKTILISLLFLSAFGLSEMQAQESIVAAGGTATGTGGSVSYSVGQVAYTNNSNGTGSVNQGVQQPFEFFIVGLDENKEITLSMIVYPNPTNDFITLKLNSEPSERMLYQLFDFNGRLLQHQQIISKETLIPMRNLPVGTYLLSISDDGKTVKKFKIIKNQ